jgi:hypothetical protein
MIFSEGFLTKDPTIPYYFLLHCFLLLAFFGLLTFKLYCPIFFFQSFNGSLKHSPLLYPALMPMASVFKSFRKIIAA